MGNKLSSNRDNITTTFTEVEGGNDNRWDKLHAARYLPGAGCTAAKLWMRGREVIGEKGHIPINTYDMGAVGLAGYVSKKGWCKLHDPSSDSLSLKMFNINNCAAKTPATAGQEGEFKDIVDLGEFKLALRAARSAQMFVHPWNHSIEAIEGFMFRTNFCAKDLEGTAKPAAILTQFVDFALECNADRWKNQEPFLSCGDLKTTWDSFYGARPTSELTKKSDKKEGGWQGGRGGGGGGFRFSNFQGPFDDACRMYNFGKCIKPPGTCTTKSGIPLRHVCNFRTNPADPNTACGKTHPAKFNH